MWKYMFIGMQYFFDLIVDYEFEIELEDEFLVVNFFRYVRFFEFLS